MELANLLGAKSIKAFLQSMPMYADFMRNTRTLNVLDPMMRDFEVFFGQSTDILKGNHLNNVDDLGSLGNKMELEASLEYSKQVLIKSLEWTTLTPSYRKQPRGLLPKGFAFFKTANIFDREFKHILIANGIEAVFRPMLYFGFSERLFFTKT
ncbi:MAG: hypothetical protein HRU29_15525 [Rhizobiales bacterium]|nr:hypothetical protein [Hyphomicrobiales bacterium]NRB15806.1 hypothetical protein [Hyphomicrobiales bacterium]